jgi:hypothetical protein
MADFVIPPIYDDRKYELEVNKNWAAQPILSAEEVAKKYYEEFLGVKTGGGFWDSGVVGFISSPFRNSISEEEMAQGYLVDVIESLPEYYRHEGFLQTVDIRPLLREYASHHEDRASSVNKFLLLPTSNKYREIIGAKIKADAATKNEVYTEEELKVEVDKLLDNESGWSPSKYVEAVDPTTIKEGEEFGFDPSIAGDVAGLSYKDFMRIHATATIEDLIGFEETGAVTSVEDAFQAQEFITNLTGTVTGAPYGSRTPRTTWNLTEAKNYIWNISPDQLSNLQESLRDAGYFDRLKAYPMKGQSPDDATVLAWDMFLADSLRNDQTPANRLQKASEDFAQRLASGQGNLFMDEANIKGAALALGSQVLGRGLDQTELDALTAAVRSWEREAYRTTATGVGEEGDLFSQVDIQSRIDNYLNDTFAEEAMWNNYANSRQATERYFGN